VSESANPATSASEPTAADVVARIVGVLEDAESGVDRFLLQQASPWEYAWRLYPTRDDDYDGGVILFDR
jgi:hypothetical protein